MALFVSISLFARSQADVGDVPGVAPIEGYPVTDSSAAPSEVRGAFFHFVALFLRPDGCICRRFCSDCPQPEVSDGHGVVPVPGAPDANTMDVGAHDTNSPTGPAADSAGADGAAYAITVVDGLAPAGWEETSDDAAPVSTYHGQGRLSVW